MPPTKYTEIDGLTEVTRLPRLGKIRLGVKVQSKTKKVKDQETGDMVPATYPKEVDYFVVPPEVEEIYGPTPRELDVLFPVNDRRVIFPQSYRLYGRSGLKCSGNGVNATYVNENWEMVDHQEGFCPCGHYNNGEGPCKRMGVLQFILPKVSISGVYQITTQSVNSIIDINSGLKYCIAQVGRFAWIPMKLRRVSTRTNHKGKPGNHFTLSLTPDIKLEQLNDLRADTPRLLEFTTHYSVEEPDLSNPADDPADIIDDTAAPAQVKKQTPKTSRKTHQDKTAATAPENAQGAEETKAHGDAAVTTEPETAGQEDDVTGAAGGTGEVDYSIKITDDHINELVALSSQYQIEDLDALLARHELPAFNQDMPDAFFEDAVAVIRESAQKLPFVLEARQGQESFLAIDQVRVIDKIRNDAGIESSALGKFMLELPGLESNSLMKIRVRHVNDILAWIEKNRRPANGQKG